MRKSSLSSESFKKKLKDQGFSYKQFADLIGVSESTIKSWVIRNEIPYYAEIILKLYFENKEYKKLKNCIYGIFSEEIRR